MRAGPTLAQKPSSIRRPPKRIKTHYARPHTFFLIQVLTASILELGQKFPHGQAPFTASRAVHCHHGTNKQQREEKGHHHRHHHPLPSLLALISCLPALSTADLLTVSEAETNHVVVKEANSNSSTSSTQPAPPSTLAAAYHSSHTKNVVSSSITGHWNGITVEYGRPVGSLCRFEL